MGFKAETEPPFSAKFLLSVVELSQRPVPRWREVAIGGRSNVGKSSLINALCAQGGLARVSKTPGRTRALNYFSVPKEQFYLVDLPGYGYAKAAKSEQTAWRAVVDRYFFDSRELVAVFALVDAQVGPTALDREFIEWLVDRQTPFRIVLTKSDKAKQSELASTIRALTELIPTDLQIVKTSADKLIGIETLRREIRETIS